MFVVPSPISSVSKVILAVPSKDTPDIVLAVANAVAVEALPTKAPVTWLNTTLSVVPTDWPIEKVTPLPEAADVTPVPPKSDNVSLSKSIDIVDDPSDISKSSKVIWLAIYAFIDCCVANAVAESLLKSS